MPYEHTSADIENASAAVEAFVAAFAATHPHPHRDARRVAIALLAQACEVAADLPDLLL